MKTLHERFTDFADLVSEAMGTPTNIGVWVFLVFMWFCLFAVNPNLQNTSFLPSWFTSNAFNFPLNTVTTLAELYIGFLCAAATNRAQRTLMTVLGKMQHVIEHLEEIDEQQETQTKELYDLLSKTNSMVEELHATIKR